MYKCLCHSCGKEDIRETLEQAQMFFQDHLDQDHHPEIIKLDEDLSKVLQQSDGEKHTMIFRTVECTDCGETRAGRRTDPETTTPFLTECPECGSTEFVDVVDQSDTQR